MIHWVSLQSILVIIVPSVLTGEGSNRSLTENQNTQIYLSKSPDVVFGQVGAYHGRKLPSEIKYTLTLELCKSGLSDCQQMCVTQI